MKFTQQKLKDAVDAQEKSLITLTQSKDLGNNRWQMVFTYAGRAWMAIATKSLATGKVMYFAEGADVLDLPEVKATWVQVCRYELVK